MTAAHAVAVTATIRFAPTTSEAAGLGYGTGQLESRWTEASGRRWQALPLRALVEVERPELFAPDRFPVFIADWPAGELYGLPIFAHPGLNVGRHDGCQSTTSETVDRTVAAEEAQDVVPLAQQIFAGFTGRVVSSAVCLYTMTPDTDFICDCRPSWQHVVIAAGFSGHGFKFAPPSASTWST